MTINNQSFTDTIRIISNCFDSNPSVNAVIGSNGNRKLKIKNLAEYAYIKTNNRNGVLVSENKKGVLLFYKSHVNPFNIKELFYELKFALSIPFKNVLYSLQRESFIKKHRIYSNYIYCWFWGVEKGGDNAVYELKNKIFELSKKENLPLTSALGHPN